MSYLHSSVPRPIVENGRTGVKVIESTSSKAAAAALAHPKTKYRDPNESDEWQQTQFIKPNIMFDPRVMRGTTAGKTAILAETMQQQQAQTQAAAHTKTLPRPPAAAATTSNGDPFQTSSQVYPTLPTRPSKQQLLSTGAIRPAQPSVAYIHNHITVVKKRVEVPVHLYLIEQKEATLTHEIDQQTDPMMEEPPTPDYIPRKTGIDTATQVDVDMVFRFDEDVQAILEVVVSKNLEQSLMEVREEEELREIELHRLELDEKYQREEKEGTEMVRKERKLFEEKEALLKEARKKHLHILEIRAKLAAGYFSRHYLANLSKDAINDLRVAGFFNQHDSVAHQLEATYMPGLVAAVDLELAKTVGARTLVTDMISEGLDAEFDSKRQILAARAKEQARLAAEAEVARLAAEELELRQRKIQLFIHTTAVPPEQSPVGPINLTGQSTVKDIEDKVYKWMEEHLGEDSEQEIELPKREYLKFLWNGTELNTQDTNVQVYDLGIQNLATLTMEYHPPPPPKPEKGSDEESGEDDDEEEEESGAAVEEEEEQPEAEDEA